MSKGTTPLDDKTQPRADPYVGVTIDGRFRIVQLVGTGGMGRVYRAIQTGLNRAVALKILDPPHGTGVSESLRQRFLAEASMTAKLHHPNTVTVIDYGATSNGTFYIAFEFLEGRTLAQVLTLSGALPWPRVLHIAQQVARSLRQAHSMGVVHRDLKPANIMLLDADSDTDLVKVLDFGLVKAFANHRHLNLNHDVTQAGMLVGSPTYMSPEQGQSSQADPRSDLYALGIVMYESLTGSPPFHGSSPIEVILKHINFPVPAIQVPADFPLLPAAVENLVLKCLAKEPENRPASMDEFLLVTQALLVSSGAFSSGLSKPSSPYLPSIDGPPPLSSPPPFPRHISSPPHFPKHVSSPPHFPASPPPIPIPLTPLPHTSPPYADTLKTAQAPRASTLSFVSPGSAPPPQPEPQSTQGIWITAFALSILSVAFVWWLFQKPPAGPYLDALPPLLPPPVIQKYNAPEELFEHHIFSKPPGATVFVDSMEQGTTPLEIKLPLSLANQSFQLRLELEGFQTLEFETLLGPHLAPVEKQLRPLPPSRQKPKPPPAVETPIENIPSIDVNEGL